MLSFKPPVIAHRGLNSLAPENTLAAFLKAKEGGFNWVEFDVMLSADHELVVIHDETLERTTNGQGRVVDYPYSYLQQLDAGSWFSPTFSDQRIPTLKMVLDNLYAHQLSANIELKALQGQDQLLVDKVLALLNSSDKYRFFKPLLSSFSETILSLIRQQSPGDWLGFLMDEWRLDWKEQCDRLHCVSVNVNEAILTEQRVIEIKKTNRCVLAYTVNSIARAKELYAWGVDAVFSDGLT